ncbi:hypothetical protein BHM03_00055133 [Ensete ventricosum]|nr:hypothetical protein BHM03_00055133 [Ensete ventricosum]
MTYQRVGRVVQHHLYLKGRDVLHRVCASVLGFQHVKHEACREGLILYLLGEWGPPPTSDGLFEGQETKRSPRGKHLRHWRRLKRVWH